MTHQYPKCMTCGNSIVPPDMRVAVYGAHGVEGFVHDSCTIKIKDKMEGSFDIQQPCSSCGTILTPKNRVDIKEFEGLCYACYSKKPKHICVDFDGVLAEYTGWKGPEHLGDPMPGSREFLKALKNMGYKVVIHTTRRPGAIQVWLRTHDFWHLVSDVTNQKIPALCYIDDRNICHEGDFDVTMEQVKNFLPYWRRPKA